MAYYIYHQYNITNDVLSAASLTEVLDPNKKSSVFAALQRLDELAKM